MQPSSPVASLSRRRLFALLIIIAKLQVDVNDHDQQEQNIMKTNTNLTRPLNVVDVADVFMTSVLLPEGTATLSKAALTASGKMFNILFLSENNYQ